jgi:Na+/melibiose symporter-like transporter
MEAVGLRAGRSGRKSHAACPYGHGRSWVGFSFGLAAYWSIRPALLGEISDAFEKETGLVCQGTFSAIYGIAIKLALSVSLMLTGYILLACGFDVHTPLGQMMQAISRMRYLYAGVPCLGMILAISMICVECSRRGVSEKVGSTR